MAWGSLTGVIFVDEQGRPFESRLQVALCAVAPRLRRTFHEFSDDVSLTEVLEETARLTVEYEAKYGEVQRLRGFAYRTSHNVALGQLRRPAVKHLLATFHHVDDGAVLASLPGHDGSADGIERNLQLKEILGLMSPRARRITVRKLLGFSSEEIGSELGMSASAVDAMFCRAKMRVGEQVRASLKTPTAGARPSGNRDAAIVRSRRTSHG